MKSDILLEAEKLAATCIHSKHDNHGSVDALHLLCKYGKGNNYYNLMYFPKGGGNALLSCTGCTYYVKEGLI